jgi:hypothetical protein
MASRSPRRPIAKTGRRSIPPAPKLQDLKGLEVGLQEAATQGHLLALLTALEGCEPAPSTLLRIEENGDPQPRDDELIAVPEWICRACRPVLGVESMGLTHDGVQGNAVVLLPYWVCSLLGNELRRVIRTRSTGRGRTAKWLSRFQADIEHWHRFALVEVASATARSASRQTALTCSRS